MCGKRAQNACDEKLNLWKNKEFIVKPKKLGTGSARDGTKMEIGVTGNFTNLTTDIIGCG
jgi:uncharacterized protein with NRDE domain